MQYLINTDPLFNCVNTTAGASVLTSSQPLVSSFIFPGGEVQTRVYNEVDRMMGSNKDAPILVATRLTDANKIMELGQVADILRRKRYTNVSAFVPYVPYMQQDRVMTDEFGAEAAEYAESFALSVFAKILNTFRFRNVFCIDPHSTVTNDGLIDGLRSVPNYPYLYNAIGGGTTTQDVDFLVAPDEGAVKKTLKYSQALKIPYIVSFKQRDPLSGKIIGVNLPREEGEKITDKTVLITDDICVGGMTFIELAKELRKYNPKKIKLFVTHGIFTKGTTLEGIDEIHCTNSCRSFPNTETFTQHPLFIPNV